MSLPVDSLYQDIGSSITASLPNNWSSTTVIAEMGPRSLTFSGYYVDENGQKHSFLVRRDTILGIMTLYQQMAASPKGKWCRAKFMIEEDGAFQVSFDYEESA